MSNSVTNICRPLRIRPTPKCVLMALADRAGDDGTAWPSLAWLCEWTCFGRRTVMDALDELERAGFIVLQREPGRQHRCQIMLPFVESTIANPGSSRTPTQAGAAPVGEREEGTNPGRSCTGAGAAPVQEPHHHPGSSRTPTQAGAAPPRAAPAPDTSITSIKTSIKTSNKGARTGAATIHELPGVSPELMADYLAVRKAKKAGPITATVVAALEREAKNAGLTLAQAITECCEAGWQGFKAAWYERRHGLSSTEGAAGAAKPRSSGASKHTGFTADYYASAGGFGDV